MIYTSVVWFSHFKTILQIPIKYNPICLKEEEYVFQKNLKSITPSVVTHYFILMVMNMLVFNFLKMMDMHQGYAYQFSDFIA